MVGDDSRKTAKAATILRRKREFNSQPLSSRWALPVICLLLSDLASFLRAYLQNYLFLSLHSEGHVTSQYDPIPSVGWPWQGPEVAIGLGASASFGDVFGGVWTLHHDLHSRGSWNFADIISELQNHSQSACIHVARNVG